MTSDHRILITGAAGLIGSFLRPRLARPGRSLRLLDVQPIADLSAGEEAVQGSVTDMALMEEACRDVDVVVHLAAEASEASWERILDLNINGTYTAFETARRSDVRRFVYASSNHAVGFYPRDAAPAPDYAFPAPDTYYGVGKVAGEALGSLYADRYGLEVISARILSCVAEPANLRTLSTWLSPDDAGRLFEAAISTPAFSGHRIVWGVSANTRGWFALEEARSIGYEPQDDAEAYAASLIEQFGEPDLSSVEHRTVGGPFCAPELNAER